MSATSTIPAGDDAATRTPAGRPGRTALTALLVVYLALLVWVVVWKVEMPWLGHPERRTLKLVPFVATARAGASTASEVAANVALLVPLGVYLGLLQPWRRLPWVAGVAAGTSLALEAVQYALAVGSSDVTDVVANTAGGLAGAAVVLAARRHGPRALRVVARVCATATLAAVASCAAFAVSPLQYGAPDVGPGTSPPRESAPRAGTHGP
ncbi:VanZ family protein [Cellulomonas fimi]|uniref:VanZ family protein n=1 Tax=Cellulomonas fimi (strain ATCC 484 / DSM 20113 / JCM 1341 / CCUG 24087 / LMG 16345 / NBRC 15513 / NCIMB 8980 / NCTC 7547 / NRS-133) TaxID=590998 RepID=F4GZ32_CELFA|nr:VanZ family protein [Cellulomonas fimi]AEE46022.1 VanZ family protein [Cellulomonas fimi ATCC 484]NNH08922.1 VanZ family protein [Cellulomonas fimi]VEH31328.1 Predicted integral membrane protein [Cellulomonas fimi]